MGSQRHDRGDDLGPEHRPGRDLHVVAELEIGRERQTLGHGDETPRLEHHHGDGAAGKGVADDELSDEVETHHLAIIPKNHHQQRDRPLLGRNVLSSRLDHPDRDNVHERKEQGYNEAPDGELRWPDLDRDDGEREHANKYTRVPPVWHLGILAHETCVNIGHLVERSAGLAPDLLAVVQQRMREGRGDGREGEAIREGKHDGQEDW